MTTKSIRPPDEVPTMAKYCTEILRRRTKGGIGHAGLWRHRKKAATLTDAECTWSIILFTGREALLTMANDVTDRKKAAEALEKSEASLAAAQRIAHLGSWELDLAHEDMSSNELRWSDETYRIFGLEPRQVPVTN